MALSAYYLANQAIIDTYLQTLTPNLTRCDKRRRTPILSSMKN
jgi:hypothetical protein